jgi:hypothetical protein
LAAISAAATFAAVQAAAGTACARRTAITALESGAVVARLSVLAVGACRHGVLLDARLAVARSHLLLRVCILGHARQREAQEKGDRGRGQEAWFHRGTPVP